MPAADSARAMDPEKEIAVALAGGKASAGGEDSEAEIRYWWSLDSLPMTSVWWSRLKLLHGWFCGAIGWLPAAIGEAKMLLQGLRGYL
jgi:hypothetical protein